MSDHDRPLREDFSAIFTISSGGITASSPNDPDHSVFAVYPRSPEILSTLALCAP